MKTIHITGDNYFGKYEHVRTACRGVIIDKGNILLSYESKNDIWMIPGGGIETGESDEDCVIREVNEETGYIYKPSECVLIIEEYYEDTKFVTKYFLGKVTGKTETHLTNEEKEGGLVSGWISIQEAMNIFSKHHEITDFEEKRGLYKREYLALQQILQ